MEELKGLLEQEWIRCPHCGIKNETDAETCFLCGKPMQQMTEAETPVPEETPDTAAVAVVPTAATAGEIVFDSDGPEDEQPDAHAEAIPEQTAAPRPHRPLTHRQKMLCWCAGIAGGILLAGLSAAGIVYAASPAHDALRELRQRYYHNAGLIYHEEVQGKWPHAQIMEHGVKQYLSDLAGYYAEEKIQLGEYAERVRAVLDCYDAPELETAQKVYFQSMMDQAYAAYTSAEPKIELSEAQNIFRTIMGQKLYTDEQAQIKYDTMTALSVSRRNYETALNAEEGERYETAIEYYRQVIESDPWYAEAQTRLQRCENTYRRQILDKVNAAKPVNSEEVQQYVKMLENGLKILPADAELSAAVQQQRILFAKARKREVLALVQDESDYFYALMSLREVLGYEQNIGDPELTAEQDRIWNLARAHLMANLRKNMETDAWVNSNALWELLEIREDTELRTLYDQFRAYEMHALCYFANWAGEFYSPGVKNMYRNEATEDPDAKNNIAPVKDAAGNKHEPFNLWQLSAVPSQTATLPIHSYDEMQHISFTIVPAASCGNGTARLQIRTGFNDASKVLYTSPKLTRNSKEIRIDLALENLQHLEIELIADSTPDGKPMVMLIDGGWIESNRIFVSP